MTTDPVEMERRLHGKRLLVVEDEYMIALDIAGTLESLGVQVVGPVGSVREALAIVNREEERLDAAVLDINLRGERVYAVADALLARHVPFIFATGYAELLLDKAYMRIPRCEKPIDKRELIRQLATAMDQAH
ncbi:CheY chemotaxis protein or a CheY-like REC (receiver) domain [Enhydrobacter aerosaccus]|uniref:CheY chemotaxis protein or a CheY-like REC (Receiver) domain n=1 Tax=Enhydrobacter aerosaccus TaxID=225324 RepID=A0A1T4TGC7_9HYPH|nr:response regulator [Enhydrobacter aerosaccus]SKA39474.1 CheY chemotaxis protein or a CheY-like REC (receiver) domain [Enhydrobacter aerosaccus]